MSATEEIKSELRELIDLGKTLKEHMKGDDATTEFIEGYQEWYTRAIKIVTLLGKDRFDEFCSYYLPSSNRDTVTKGNYAIQDFFFGVWPNARASRVETIFHPASVANLKFLSQLSILISLSSRVDSVLSDVIGHLLAELQDNELKMASQLIDINLRAAGALAGVVLEGHLQRVAANHGIIVSKKNPTISDLNDTLRNNEVYDLVTWRKIQHLTDIRNYCDHKKEREPTEEEVKEIIVGTDSIIKTVF